MVVDREDPQVERLAAVIADAFGPVFAAAATTPAKPVRTPVRYQDMPETTKDIFREVAQAVLTHRLDWQEY